jgi:hypothetical protein
MGAAGAKNLQQSEKAKHAANVIRYVHLQTINVALAPPFCY